MNDDQIEQHIQAKGLTAPRITLDDIEGHITCEHYFTAADGLVGAAAEDGHTIGPHPDASIPSLTLVTFCVMILRNGHRIIGVNTGPVSTDNFDAELGRKLARKHAIEQIWPLMGYALRERLAWVTQA